MPNTNKKHDQEKPFIKQTIIEEKRDYHKKVISVVCLALAFGIIAGMAMTVTSNFINKRWFNKREQATIEIPKGETDEESSEEASSEPVEDIVASAIESINIELTEADLEKMYAGMVAVAEKKDNALVNISVITTDTDWFNNTLRNESSCSGIVIANLGESMIILSPDISSEGDVKAGFFDGSVIDANVLGRDRLTDLMVLSVDISALGDNIKQIEPINMGNSYQLKRGAFLIAIGSPMGKSQSIDIGNITAIVKDAGFFDGFGRVIYYDKHLDNKGTFLLNTSGDLVGIVSNLDYGTSVSVAYGISDLKMLIENMTNGVGYAYLGVRALDIDKEKAPQQMPTGIYVSEVRGDSPAYNAGIQSGDIISVIGDEEVDSVSEFKNIMEKLKPNQVVTVKVNRSGKEGFTELNFEITIGARN